MLLENMNLKEEFIEGLRLIIKQGYDPQEIAKYAYKHYMDSNNENKNLEFVIYDLMMMDADPDMEMTEQEVKELVKDKLGVDL